MNIRFVPGAAAVLLVLSVPAPAVAAPDAAVPGPVFSSLDTDHDGALSPQEFRAGWPALQQAIALELKLREQFRVVDADRSGRLDPREYAGLVLVQQAGAKGPPLGSFDADRDGALDFAEYVAVVRALAVPAAAPAPAAAASPATAENRKPTR